MTGRGWSVGALLKKSKLRLDRSSLQRRLSGRTNTTTSEAETLAKTLGITLVWPRAGRR